jgi:hypothetical protein
MVECGVGHHTFVLQMASVNASVGVPSTTVSSHEPRITVEHDRLYGLVYAAIAEAMGGGGGANTAPNQFPIARI